ncbi:hypothetical protein JXL83_05725 [candidate division WOR-3 bacterium]|nr:hypothetical protein [candidate division WOR-3 bacterium]
MKKCLICCFSVVLLLSSFSCVTESEADASGKIKRAELALKNLRQTMDKFYQVRGHYPFLSENLTSATYDARLTVNDSGIYVICENRSVYLSYIKDTLVFNESSDSILFKNKEFLLRRWVYYLRTSDRHLIIDTLDASLSFVETEDLSAILRVKDTSFLIALRDGGTDRPFHIYDITPDNLLAVKDSGIIAFVPGDYDLTFTSYSYEEKEGDNSLWLFDTLAVIEDTAVLNEIKDAISLEGFSYITSDPYRKYFISAHSPDRNRTPVTTRKIAKSSYDYSPENIQATDPSIFRGI